MLAFICLFKKWIKMYVYCFPEMSYVIKPTKYQYFITSQKQHM